MAEAERPLRGCVAVVTGASRGIGLGVAHELGLAGATVYVTGRSTRQRPDPEGMPGTVEETAALVSEAGGKGIAVVCDHTDEAAVDALAERVRTGHGGLDLLVNAAWGGYEHYEREMFDRLPWEQPLWRWDKMMTTGLRATYMTTRALLPLVHGRPRPLVVNVSAGDGGTFLGDVQYDVVKAAVDRLGFALARRLRGEGILALTVHPGFTRTERVVAIAPPDILGGTHTARFVGRGVVALHTDPALPERNGGVFKAGQLGLDYGFTDIDGSQPEPFVIPEQG